MRLPESILLWIFAWYVTSRTLGALLISDRRLKSALLNLGLLAAFGLSLAVPITLAQQFSVGMFSPWSGYAIPNGLWLTGDFNGDGKTDILHAVENTDYVNVWLSNGDGTFKVTSFSPWPGYAIPNGIWLTGDFNGDGKTDILHAVANTDYANVWLSNGDGTFKVTSFSPWAGYGIPNGIWLTGDFNGDGKTDILHAVQDTDYANVWLSNGDGTFKVTSFSPWAGYAIPNGVWLTGDFNGDGNTDVFHAVQDTDYANIWLSNGDGTFNVTSFSPWAGYAIPNGLWLAGDITGDHKTDIVHAVANTDYVHPWISLFPVPGPASLAGLEVTQAIQDMVEDVPLIAGKTTWVRAYLDAPSSGSVTVTGTLAVKDLASGTVTNVVSNNAVTLNPVQNGQLRTKRENLSLSLNFPLPSAPATAGQREFTLTSLAKSPSGRTEPCSNCATNSLNETFVNSAPLRVRIVGLSYTVPPSTTVNQPSATDFNLLKSWLGRAYPVAQVISSQTTVASSNAWPFSCGQANAQLSALRATEVGAGTDARTHYYGLVSNAGGYMRGCSSVPSSPDPSATGSGPTGNPAGPGPVPVNVTGDTDGSFGDWYGGHELGHTFGRLHPGFCNGNSADDPNFPNPNGQISDNAGTYTGLDTGDPANNIPVTVLPGAARFDIMTYCNQPQWLSAYAYNGVRNRLNAEDPSGTGAPGAGEARMLKELVTPQGIHFKSTCPCPSVKPHEQEPARIKTEREKPLPPVRAYATPLLAPKPQRHKPERPDFQGKKLTPRKPALAAPAIVQRAVSLEALFRQPAPEKMQMELKEGRFVSMVGTLNLTRHSGKILYVNHVPRVLIPNRVPEARAFIRFLDRRGKPLRIDPVTVREDTDVPPNEDRTAVFDAVVEELANVGAVELVMDEKVLDRRAVPRHVPNVKGVRISAADARGVRVLQWQASHPERRPLTYLVQISSDGGKTWETLALGQREPRLELKPEQLKERASAAIRVIANDGYNDSEAVTEQLSK